MKILIYGEYSGYGKSLATGFRQLGYKASVFSPRGDGWKEIDVDIKLQSKNKLFMLFELLMLTPKFLEYDIVIMTNPEFFRLRFIGPYFLALFKFTRKKIFLLCCGHDVEYIRAGESGIIDRYPLNGIKKPRDNYFKGRCEKIIHHLCAMSAMKIIPVMYDYECAWKTSKYKNKLTPVIPLACSIDKCNEIKKTDPKNIHILHGINRPDEKGSYKILSALNRISKEFDNVVIHTPEKLSQTEYFKIFSQVDIAIDQCRCHSYGMNAIYSMLYGHVTLAPADDKHCLSFGIQSSPIISIYDDEDNIYEALKELVINCSRLDEIKMLTRGYAEKFHSPSRVCTKILDIIKGIG